MSNPFEQASTAIFDVLTGNVEGEVRLGPPGEDDQATDPVVDIHLLGMTVGPRQAMAETRPAELEYLVSVLADGPTTPTTLYAVCRAIELSPDHDLSTEPVPLGWWSAFGVRPRAAVRVTASSWIETPIERGQLVTEPVIIRSEIKQPQQPLPSTARKG